MGIKLFSFGTNATELKVFYPSAKAFCEPLSAVFSYRCTGLGQLHLAYNLKKRLSKNIKIS
jgi:hypothetical protein